MFSERIESVIKTLETKIGKPLSRLKVGVLSHSVLDEVSKLLVIYLDGNAESNLIINEAIYKTNAGFYIYVKNDINNHLVEGTILFDPENLEEVKFTIIRLKKIK